MTSLRTGASVVTALLVTFFSVADICAQSIGDGTLALQLTPDTAEKLAPLPTAYRVYGEPSVLGTTLTLVNQSDASIIVDQDAMRRAFRLRLSATDEVPLEVEWPSEIRLPGDLVPTPNTWAPLIVEPRTAVSWLIAITRADGLSFRSGRYSVEYQLPGVEVAVSRLDGNPWRGSAPPLPGSWILNVAPPSTPREISSMHRLVAQDAVSRRDFTEAVATYSRALASDPTDREAEWGLATSFVALGRYQDAISSLERMGVVASPNGLAAELLAIAYVGAGDEQKAGQVLRMSGVPADRLAAKIAEFKEVNRRRR